MTTTIIRDAGPVNLEELKAGIDLAAYVESTGIKLKKQGSRDLVGLCPFHEDRKTPSFVVTPHKQLWHCMGCGKGGTIIDYVMEREDVDFRGALDVLKGAEITLRPPTASSSAEMKISPDRARQLLERSIAYYEKELPYEPCGAYLRSRGLMAASGTLLGRMRVGHCNGTLTSILPSDGSVHDELKSLGILTDASGSGRAYGERFKDCIVFPVFDLNGEVTTLYGRYVGKGSKRHVYLPDRPTGYWNVGVAKSFHEVILVESVIDAMSVIVSGYDNVIGIQGTNGMTAEGVELLKSCGVRKIRLLMDGDASGKKAAARIMETLENDFSCEILTLPDDHDPNSYLVERGPSRLASFLSESRVRKSKDETKKRDLPKNAFEVICGLRKYVVVGVDRQTRKIRATVRLEHAGKLHVDTLDLYSSRSRQQLARDLCRVFELDADAAEADVNRILVACEECDAAPANQGGAEDVEAVEITDDQEKEARELGRSKNLTDVILKDFVTCGLIGEEMNKLLGYLAMTSRKMTDPLSVLILSSSGAGKTALQDGVLKFCPPEELVKLTSLSGKALFYKDRMSLKHKVLALEEGAGAEEASYAIRNLISADLLTSEVTVRDPVSGNMTTMSNTVEGPTSVFVTTTDPWVDAETKSRFLVTGIDESRMQTRLILEFQRKRHGMSGLDDDLDAEKVIERHRNFQRMLKPVMVINNHADNLTFDDDRLQARRLQPQYLSLINAVAFLRQMTKKIRMHNGVEYVEVDDLDVEIGNTIAIEILGRTLDELTMPARNLLNLTLEMVRKKIERLKEERPDVRTGDVTFTRKELREFSGWTQTRMRNHLKELIELEYVMLDSGGNGKSLQLYRLAYDGEGDDGGKFIPGVRETK